MEVYVENITEDLGGEGLSVYSLVRGMDFFKAEVRESGVSIIDPEGVDVYEYSDALGDELKNATLKQIIEENRDEAY